MSGIAQPWHIIVILLVVLIVFGGRKLPEIGRSLGTGMREFKDSITGHATPPDSTASVAQATERGDGEPGRESAE